MPRPQQEERTIRWTEEPFAPLPEADVPQPVPVRRKTSQARPRIDGPVAPEEVTVSVEEVSETSGAPRAPGPAMPAMAAKTPRGLPKGAGSTADRLLARVEERRSQAERPVSTARPRSGIPYIPVEFHVPRERAPPSIERRTGTWESPAARKVDVAEPGRGPAPEAVRPAEPPGAAERARVRPLRRPSGAVAPKAVAPRRRPRRRAAPPPSPGPVPFHRAVLTRLRHPMEPRRTSDRPPLRTRSGLAGVFLLVVFALGIAQAAMMLGTTVEHPEGGGRLDSVLVEVRDDQGTLVAGAFIEMDDAETAITGVAGVASFEQVAYGDHTIVVTRTGYGRATYRVTITGSSETMTLMLPRSGTRDVDERVTTTSGESEVPVASVIIAGLAAVAFAGGVLSFRGFGRFVPSVGAVAGLATIGFVVGPILSLFALMLVLSSSREFAPDVRCPACTGRMTGGAYRCANCGSEYHVACADSVRKCVVCGEYL
ncbi:MAG: hypothetical protein L0Z54_06670 [Thermoplasmata archaeon]|nr:hypothetical protein [Thermoplasmata archaeon]